MQNESVRQGQVTNETLSEIKDHMERVEGIQREHTGIVMASNKLYDEGDVEQDEEADEDEGGERKPHPMRITIDASDREELIEQVMFT